MPKGFRLDHVLTPKIVQRAVKEVNGPKPKKSSSPFTFILFFGVALLLFLYLQKRPQPAPAAPPPAPVATSMPATQFYGLVIGWALSMTGIFLLFWRAQAARRVQRMRVLDWGWDDSGLWFHDETSKERVPWSWVTAVGRSGRRVRVEYASETAFVVPAKAFDSPQQRDEFVTLANQKCVPTAKETGDGGPRGFEVRND